MKILWVGPGFLHPTTRGGQIRTLETLRHLSRRHEIHYAATADPDQPEGPERSGEYSARAFPVPFRSVPKNSPAFALQLAKGLFSSLPVVMFRWQSEELRKCVAELERQNRYDCIVCDFLNASINMPALNHCVLFQHNVETMIWRRLAENARDPIRRAYLSLQAKRMFRYEERVCRSAAHVIAVSENDAELMRSMFGVSRVSAVPTGVDVEYFSPRANGPRDGLVFVGSMDYMANVDGVLYFVSEILPLIRRRRPDCRLTIVGRKPPAEIKALSLADPLIEVTGTVPDVRPYLWRSAVSIVPLRVGGGTRLKIYESMAARTAVVSTSIGAEGLSIHPPDDIRLADTPEAFAWECVQLLDNEVEREMVAEAGRLMVSQNFSWDKVSRYFENVLKSCTIRR